MRKMQAMPIAVLGATAAGIGAALARPEETVLLESGMLLAPEYVASLNIRRFQKPSGRDQAMGLYAQCQSLGLLDAAGHPHVFPLPSLLAQRLLDSNADVRLCAMLTRAERLDEGWLLTYFDAEGFHTLKARELLDTREQPSGRRSLCAMLAGSGTRPHLPESTGASLLQGALPGEFALKLPVSAEWPMARAALRDFWRKFQPEGWQIASVAPCYAYDYEAPVVGLGPDGRHQCVSSAFGDLMSAFEGGIACACTL